MYTLACMLHMVLAAASSEARELTMEGTHDACTTGAREDDGSAEGNTHTDGLPFTAVLQMQAKQMLEDMDFAPAGNLGSGPAASAEPPAAVLPAEGGFENQNSQDQLLLLSGQHTQQAAQQPAEQAGLTFDVQPFEAMTSFKYLGITFQASKILAGAAASARTKAAWAALHNSRAQP